MNKRCIFVDTGAWVALSDESDQYHTRAAVCVKMLVNEGYALSTSNLIIHETFMLLSRRISRKVAVRFLDKVYNADNLRIFHSDRVIEQEAFETIRKYIDQDFSITDAVSFAIMKREGLKRVFSFDKHFKTMRFSLEP
jgi:uncharacterized protein